MALDLHEHVRAIGDRHIYKTLPHCLELFHPQFLHDVVKKKQNSSLQHKLIQANRTKFTTFTTIARSILKLKLLKSLVVKCYDMQINIAK
jgi:hypothetical protein